MSRLVVSIGTLTIVAFVGSARTLWAETEPDTREQPSVRESPGPASTAKSAPQAPVIIQQYPSNPVPYRGVPIFDDKIFDGVGKSPEEESVAESPATGAKRLQDRRKVDYNADQRNQWIEECKAKDTNDSKSYRDCFASKQKGNKDIIDEKQKKTENRSSFPYRDTQSVTEQTGRVGNGFDGVEVKTQRDE